MPPNPRPHPLGKEYAEDVAEVDRLLRNLQKMCAAAAPVRSLRRDYSEEVVKVRRLLEGLRWEAWESASDHFEWDGASVSVNHLSIITQL